MKSLMFIFNGLVWILGIVLIIIGIVVLVEGNNWDDIIDNKTVPVSIMLLIVGVMIAIVGFLGCCGAMKQNTAMLLIYAIVLSIIILVQLVAGILAFIFSDEAEEVITEKGQEFLKTYNGIDTTSLSLNAMMEEFKCCGMSGASDWSNTTVIDNTLWNVTNVPDSCCKRLETNCGINYNDKDMNIYHNGCLQDTIDFFRSNFKLAGIVGLAFVVIEIIQVIFSCILRKHMGGLVA